VPPPQLTTGVGAVVLGVRHVWPLRRRRAVGEWVRWHHEPSRPQSPSTDGVVTHSCCYVTRVSRRSGTMLDDLPTWLVVIGLLPGGDGTR
jgi:hypothetical protein